MQRGKETIFAKGATNSRQIQQRQGSSFSTEQFSKKSQNSNEFSSAIYSIELLGDSTMISFQISGTLISVKAAKDYSAKIGDIVTINIANSACHLFNTDTGTLIKEIT